MSFWSRFRRAPQATPNATATFPAGRHERANPFAITDAERAAGVRNLSDRDYRKERIGQYVAAMADPAPENVASLTAFLDLWDIAETTRGFLATPRWDDEPMLARNTHPTREEAEAYVAIVGGKLGSE